MIFWLLCSMAFAAGDPARVLSPKLLLQTPTAVIRDITVAADGSLFTFDYENYKIGKFDSNGRFLLDFGGSGTEPGRFTHLTGIRAVDDRLLAVDSTGVAEFDLDGRFRKKTAFAEEVTPNFSAALPDGRYVGSLIVAAELKSVLTLRSREGLEIARLASHDLKEFFPELKPGEDFFLDDAYARGYLYAVGPENNVYWIATDALRLHLYRDGATRIVLADDMTPIQMPEAERAKLLARKAKIKPPLFAYVPERLPLVHHLALGPDGDIWMYVESREKTGFLRYSKEGKPKGLYSVSADFNIAKAVVRIFGSRMYFILGKNLYTAELPAA